jgi:hypothetical protein
MIIAATPETQILRTVREMTRTSQTVHPTWRYLSVKIQFQKAMRLFFGRGRRFLLADFGSKIAKGSVSRELRRRFHPLRFREYLAVPGTYQTPQYKRVANR